MSNTIVLSILILLCFLLFSCSNNPDSSSQNNNKSRSSDNEKVEIRIQNETGKDISLIWLGSRITKANSYSSKSYQIIFNEVQNGTTSDYKPNPYKFWGYTRGNLTFADKTQGFIRLKDMESALRGMASNMVSDSMQHPYTKEWVEKPRLTGGKYTFVLQAVDANGDVRVRIVKD